MNFRRSVASLTLLFPYGLLAAASPADYAGQYVLKLGSRNFLVLHMQFSGGRLRGAVERPRHSSLGSTFSNISSEVIREPIATGVIEGDHLHLVVSDPADASDTDEFDLTLLTRGAASIQVSGMPVDPWKLARVPSLPILHVNTDWDPKQTYYAEDIDRSSSEMQRVYDADQKAREPQTISPAQWEAISRDDELRRGQVRKFLQSGILHSGKDFGQAAFIFQHGSTPGDYLMAHTLAMTALARGNAGALWIATATLDRYLNAIGQPQIYGTQFHSENGGAWTQEPYDRALITDELRRRLGVPSLPTQQVQLEEYKAGAGKH